MAAGTVPRWAAACISLGPLIHIAGDIWWTATGGILLLALGLGILARVQLATIMAVKVRRTAHPVLVAGHAQRAGSRLG